MKVAEYAALINGLIYEDILIFHHKNICFALSNIFFHILLDLEL